MYDFDVLLIGGGIMSATLGALLKRLDPSLRIQLYEVAEDFAQEASFGWHNAGTGHAGICELSYTPDRGADGEVDVAKAISIFADFENSLQFWAAAVRDGMAGAATDFVNPVPHLSFVHGGQGVDFLASRFRGLRGHHFFESMEFTDDPATVEAWAPLLMGGRGDEAVAATKMAAGTDVNFGALAQALIGWLAEQEGCGAEAGHRVEDLVREGALWKVKVRRGGGGDAFGVGARFVFVGAGGGSLRLLQRSGIPEAKGYGGFPIAGQWLVCDKPEVVGRHHAKVYGAALGAAPTMAVPHLDTRIISGQRALLFGPYGSWTTKFLHRGGSVLDLPLSVRPDNLWPLVKTGACNLSLVGYLVGQGLQTMETRFRELHRFYPEAREEDWRLVDAGIRVQAIKSVEGDAGIVHFGTEVVTDEKCTLAALLGASPGASVSTQVMLEVIGKCFPELLEGGARRRLLELIPTFGRDLCAPEEAEFYRQHHAKALEVLGIR